MSAARAPIVLATRSAGKIRELAALCAEAGFATETLGALGLSEDPREMGIECFATFAENAEAKAAWFAALLPDRLVLAEDSGLEVDALGGAPGVHSKRWSGADATGVALDAANNAALVAAMLAASAPSAQSAQSAQSARSGAEPGRAARYVCVAVLARDAARWRGTGRVEGTIAHVTRGSNGFGYDPYFSSDELGCTFGEASAEAKARVSHRARAVRALFADARVELERSAGAR